MKPQSPASIERGPFQPTTCDPRACPPCSESSPPSFYFVALAASSGTARRPCTTNAHAYTCGVLMNRLGIETQTNGSTQRWPLRTTRSTKMWNTTHCAGVPVCLWLRTWHVGDSAWWPDVFHAHAQLGHEPAKHATAAVP
eukprot:6765763-Alexandrium_andersonii.AAC.1